MNRKVIVHFMKALAGDCFLIELPDKNCILIDCGYQSTYRLELKPLLSELAKKECRIALLVITHIDEDHIGGACSLIEDNGDCYNPKIIPIDNIWFNGIFELCRQDTNLSKHIQKKLQENNSERYSELLVQFLKLIANGEDYVSASQAQSFEELCKVNHYTVNGGCKNLVQAGEQIFFGESKVKALAPEKREIQGFAEWVDKELCQYLGKDYTISKNDFMSFLEKMIMATAKDDNGCTGVWEVSSSIPDIGEWFGTSTLAPMNVVNRASIVIEIECYGKRLLFMGDSESEDWAKRLHEHYDLIKLSHHGTTKPNIELLNRTIFDRAVISTNGRRNHPEDELLARIIKSRTKEIFFNYEIRRKDDLILLQDKYGFRVFFDENRIIIE